jgi:CheY-like chemotaxis protein
MTPDQLDKLFDEYSRFNMEANRTTEGTGLGMGIAQNLIHMMGGEITAESEAGKGSLFTVRLPQTNTGAPPLGKETADRLKQFRLIYESKMENIQIVREPIPFGKVLVVDDMEMNIYVAKEMLSPYGLQIDVATSGYDAIKKVKANVYDVVFMDHMMPIMDGVQTVGEIRKLGKEFEKLPIVALTANAVSGMREMFLANGFNDFISKPIIIQELDAILKTWMTPEKITERKKTEASDDDGQYDGFLSGIAKIREINTALGLNQAGSKGIYYNTLDIFYKKLVSECDNMTVFLEAKDMHAFTISIHAMKSMLAIIGALALSETAMALESASKDGDVDFCMRIFGDFKETLLSLHKRLTAVFQDAAERLPENTAKAPVVAQETPATKKVLLVDDTEMVLFITKGKLSSYGLQVDTATSGLQAITKIKDGSYDLVFMDHMMPEMDGVETAREIKKLSPQYEKLPIIALTANVEPGAEEFFMTNGFSGFLAKPIVKEKLETILEKWIPKTVKNP